MNKTLIVGAVVGLLLGLAGTTGMVVVRAGESAAALRADSLARADSVAKSRPRPRGPSAVPAALKVDTTVASVTRVDSTSAAAATQPASPSASTTVPPTTPPAAGADLAGAAAAPAPADSLSHLPTLERARLAKIFGAMEPEQAAKVLVKMSDAEVRAVLASVRDRQAAAILSNLPPERAAQIGSAVFQTKGQS
ncbi:MAG TPA: hypothetical protein VFL93_00625 [Longimicrobiaceae bacterium]|nr:hypothetical protein [Longimicrobiaceae bacterium]